MATIDLGEAKAHLSEARNLALKAREEAMRLGGKAWERASPTMSRLMEEPRSFLARFQPEPEPPKAHWAMIAGVAAVGFVAGAAALGARKVAMQALTHHADWVKSLEADHRLAETLFDALLKTRDSQRTKRKLLLSKLTYALAKHQFEEENVVYPALREANRELAAKRLAGEHFDMKSCLHELNEMAMDDPEFLTRVDALRVMVASHVREEEEDIFPAFRDGMSEAENLKLTKAINREGLKLA
jgi:hemerythrin superfamily protein